MNEDIRKQIVKKLNDIQNTQILWMIYDFIKRF
jgi:hypothetical protein